MEDKNQPLRTESVGYFWWKEFTGIFVRHPNLNVMKWSTFVHNDNWELFLGLVRKESGRHSCTFPGGCISSANLWRILRKEKTSFFKDIFLKIFFKDIF